MSKRRIIALQACLLLAAALFADAASRNTTMRIKVLDSETRALSLDDNGVPRNCDQVTFDAYCRSTQTAPLENILLVQEGDGPPFRISCIAQSKYSRCAPLPKGTSLEARREKKGVTVYFVDDNGKLRSQLYTLVAGDRKAGAGAQPPANAGNAAADASPATVRGAGTVATNAGAGASATSANDVAATSQATGAPAMAAAATSTLNSGQAAVTGSLEPRPQETVKCSFSSTPAGAEVTVDGRYVGSTPSVLGMATGTHVVVISMAGFQQWKRELSVSAGSELTVNAVLQKVQ